MFAKSPKKMQHCSNWQQFFVTDHYSIFSTLDSPLAIYNRCAGLIFTEDLGLKKAALMELPAFRLQALNNHSKGTKVSLQDLIQVMDLF